MQTGMIDNTAATTAATKTATPSNTMDKNAFLKLLVAQLKNQDPTQSQDPNQMVQQMTSFSSLEQMQNTNSLLTGIQGQNNGLFQSNSASLIGKKVRVASPNFDLKGGKASVGIDLAATANVTLTILGAGGAHGGGEEILKTGRGALVADGVQVGQVVADHAQGVGVGAQAGEAGVEGRIQAHDGLLGFTPRFH